MPTSTTLATFYLTRSPFPEYPSELEMSPGSSVVTTVDVVNNFNSSKQHIRSASGTVFTDHIEEILKQVHVSRIWYHACNRFELNRWVYIKKYHGLGTFQHASSYTALLSHYNCFIAWLQSIFPTFQIWVISDCFSMTCKVIQSDQKLFLCTFGVNLVTGFN